MKRLVLAALFALLPTVLLAQAPYYPTEWNTEGVKTAPGTGVTLCQFIETAESTTTHEFRVVLSSQGLGVLVMEHMDSTNASALRSHVYIVNAATYETNMLIVTLNPSERVRVRPFVAVGATLNVQCSIFAKQ